MIERRTPTLPHDAVLRARDELRAVARRVPLSELEAEELANNLAMGLGDGHEDPLTGAYVAVRQRVEQRRIDLSAERVVALSVELARAWTRVASEALPVEFVPHRSRPEPDL